MQLNDKLSSVYEKSIILIGFLKGISIVYQLHTTHKAWNAPEHSVSHLASQESISGTAEKYSTAFCKQSIQVELKGSWIFFTAILPEKAFPEPPHHPELT